MTTFEIQPRGPFSLKSAATFWGGFTPAAHSGLDAEGHLHLAFPVERTWQSVGVCLRQARSGVVEGEVYGEADPPSVRDQTARILSLDTDGRAFPEIASRDPVVASLQQRFPGLRPVCFYSPYEAAVWAILSQRIRNTQAAQIKRRLAEALGEHTDIHGEPMRAFPPPSALRDLDSFPGLPGPKLDRLHAIAGAALAGDLDAASIRSLPEDIALARLQALPGIGPFSAELILLRGAAHPDYLTLLEPRFRTAVQKAYALPALPSDADLRRVSEGWRPYRMWVTFLLRQNRHSLD